MPHTIDFTRSYAAFDTDVRPFEQSPDVGRAITACLLEHDHIPATVIINVKIAAFPLRMGETAGDVNNLDLIFQISEPFIEDIGNLIVLRSGGEASYGGLVLGSGLVVTEEIIDGHRVLTTLSGDGSSLRSEFSVGSRQYQVVP